MTGARGTASSDLHALPRSSRSLVNREMWDVTLHVTFRRGSPSVIDMRMFLLLVSLVASVSRAAAEGATWQAAGGAVAGRIPGGAGTFDVAWPVSETVAIGGHGAVLVDVAGENVRLYAAPVASFSPSPGFSLSLSAGYVHVQALTLHSMAGYERIGGSFAVRHGLGAERRVTVGLELNWIPETLVYRDLYVDVGGFTAAVLIGAQAF
jgi:hypothetical protein